MVSGCVFASPQKNIIAHLLSNVTREITSKFQIDKSYCVLNHTDFSHLGYTFPIYEFFELSQYHNAERILFRIQARRLT